MEELTDVRYEVDDGLAGIVIERPERLNAFRARTIDELIACFTRAWASPDVGVVCLTGAADRAFCTGGDQKQRAETGDYGPSNSGLFEVERLHALIRDIPKAGDRGGQRLRDRGRACPARHLRPHDRRRHRPLRPDRPARGLVRRRLRHRLPGPRDRREARPRGLDALPAVRRGDRGALGPGQHGRPAAELRAEVRHWADDILALSPTALRFVKQSFNVDTEQLAGVGKLAFSGLCLFLDSDEAAEGVEAFTQKRRPDFSPYCAGASA
jgi:2-ketocyclohexanecarboxyl-CoA hydrolase